MTHVFDGSRYIVRLDKGELLVESLTRFVIDKNIRGAWINGLGGVLWAELGFYQLETQDYIWKKFDQLLEITSLQGNVAWSDDKPVLHMHGAFSDLNMQGLGGHVKEAAAAGTCEIIVQLLDDKELNRTEDPETGLKLLSL